MKKSIVLTALAAAAFIASGCSPEVGSKEWCKAMKEKPKGDWTVSETQDYAKHCIFQ